MENDGRHYPNKLRKYRKIMGYTQIDVARLLGFKSSTRISMWEQGVAMPSALNLVKLSIIYRTLIKELYSDLAQEIRSEITARENELRGDFEQV